MEPRDLTASDLDWVHALNQANGEALSFMERDAFEAMAARAAYARVLDDQAGFLLAYARPPIPESSPNFDWFAGRFENVLYIDRVAVADHARRQGIAARLYADLVAFARDSGFGRIGAEINSDPPNPGSDAFHAARGFQTVGEARLEGRGKTVRYVALTPADAA